MCASPRHTAPFNLPSLCVCPFFFFFPNVPFTGLQHCPIMTNFKEPNYQTATQLHQCCICSLPEKWKWNGLIVPTGPGSLVKEANAYGTCLTLEEALQLTLFSAFVGLWCIDPQRAPAVPHLWMECRKKNQRFVALVLVKLESNFWAASRIVAAFLFFLKHCLCGFCGYWDVLQPIN